MSPPEIQSAAPVKVNCHCPSAKAAIIMRSHKFGGGGLLQQGARSLITVAFAGALLVACNHSKPSSDFVVVRSDREITGHSKFPVAVDPNRVGTYPPDTKSGAGYFYDDVLEYRVWLHPEKGAEHLNGTHDYFVAFANLDSGRRESRSAATAVASASTGADAHASNESTACRFSE